MDAAQPAAPDTMSVVTATLRDHYLSGGQIAVLTHLAIHPGCDREGVTAAQIARQCIFTESYITAHLDALAHRGLIRRVLPPVGAFRYIIVDGEAA